MWLKKFCHLKLVEPYKYPCYLTINNIKRVVKRNMSSIPTIMINEQSSESKKQGDNSKKESINFDLSKFVPSRILSNSTNKKVVCVLGKFINLSEENSAIVILEKTAFTEKQLTSNDEYSYFTIKSRLHEAFFNDIYGNFVCFPNPDINTLKTTIIYPATDKHINKFSSHANYLIQETPQLYTEITLPHIEQEQFSITWLYNVLDHQQEVERIVFEDPCEKLGFILLPDLKWDGVTLETLYLLAITRDRNIKSLRDLTDEHLPLLYNIRDKGISCIAEKYNIPRSQLRIFFHYQPSFYHLHVHFTNLNHEPFGIFCEKSHLLDTVIQNIELSSQYYQKATLPFVINDNDQLFPKYEKIIKLKTPNAADDKGKIEKTDDKIAEKN